MSSARMAAILSRGWWVNFKCFYVVWIRRRWPHVSKTSRTSISCDNFITSIQYRYVFFLCDVDVELKIKAFLITHFRFYFPVRQHGTCVTFIPPFIRNILSFCLISCFSLLPITKRFSLNIKPKLISLVPHICVSESGQHWFG